MWRYLVGGAAGALAIVAGMMLQATRPVAPPPLASAKASGIADGGQTAAATDDPPVPEALPKTREEKRFNRYDKDRNGSITREEYLIPRHKAFAKLDRDGNGVLSFDEWAVKTETKFATADKDKSGAMNAAEFATTAVKRKARPRSKCPEQPAAPPAPEEPGEES